MFGRDVAAAGRRDGVSYRRVKKAASSQNVSSKSRTLSDDGIAAATDERIVSTFSFGVFVVNYSSFIAERGC
jgi:hypothetical protein